MDKYFNEKNELTDNEFEEFHRISKEKAILSLESLPMSAIIGFDSYTTQLRESLAEEYDKYVLKNKTNRELKFREIEDIVNELVDSYDQQIGDILDMMVNEKDLIQTHNKIKKKLIKEFKEKTRDSNDFDLHAIKLEDKIEKSFEDSKELLDLRLKNTNSQTINLKTLMRKYYEEEMNKYYQKSYFLSKEKLLSNHSSVLERTVNKFAGKRGQMSFDRFKDFVEETVEDIFEKIKEKNDMNTPTLPAIGIDLGTTNSCVAYYKPGLRNTSPVVVIENEFGFRVTPSVVSIRPEGKVVGNVAKDEKRAHIRDTIYSDKRLIGCNYSEEKVQQYIKRLSYVVFDDGLDNPKIRTYVGNSEDEFFAEEISAEVLKKMKATAERYLGVKVTKAVITVPAYFTEGRKEATKQAGIIAGLDVLKVIFEPTAAALAFHQNKTDYSSRYDLFRKFCVILKFYFLQKSPDI